MLKKNLSLKWWFAATIAVITILFLFLPLALKEAWCDLKPRYQEWSIGANKHTTRNQYATNESQSTFPAKQNQSQNGNDDSYSRYSEYLKRSGFCEEAKVTDIA